MCVRVCVRVCVCACVCECVYVCVKHTHTYIVIHTYCWKHSSHTLNLLKHW